MRKRLAVIAGGAAVAATGCGKTDVIERQNDEIENLNQDVDRRSIADSYQWKYPSSWELSTTRANAVAHYLLENHNIDPERVKSAGLSNHHPVSEADPPEARANNRRVEIVVGSKRDIEKHMAAHTM